MVVGRTLGYRDGLSNGIVDGSEVLEVPPLLLFLFLLLLFSSTVGDRTGERTGIGVLQLFSNGGVSLALFDHRKSVAFMPTSPKKNWDVNELMNHILQLGPSTFRMRVFADSS